MNLFEQSPDCPSEHTRDLFVLGYLPEEAKRAVAAHLRSCTVCAEKVRVASMGFDAFPAFDTDSIIDSLHQMSAGTKTPRWFETALGTKPSTSHTSRPGRFGKVKWAGAAIAACAAAVLVLFVYKAPLNIEESSEVLRVKGGLKLEVLRKRNGAVSETLTGERFFDGDRLRFRVSLPTDGYVMVVGVEQDQTIYPCCPITGKARRFSESRDLLLPDAVRLDDSLGEEWLHLILCPKNFDISAVHPGLHPGTLLLPSGCSWDSFEIDKGLR